MLNLDLVPRNGDGDLILRQDENGGTLTISVADFQARFTGASIYDEYKNHPNSTVFWDAIFDDWKAKGYFVA